MASNMRVNAKCRFLMAMFFALNCVVLSYAALSLERLGLSNWETAMVVAAACALGGILMVVAGRIADKSDRWYWKNQLILFSSCELALAILRLFVSGTVTRCIIYALLIVFLFLMMPMVNLASFYYSSRGVKVNFGIARGIGSVVFAAVSFLAGWLTMKLGHFVIPTMTAVFSAGILVAALLMPKIASAPSETAERIDSQPTNRKGFVRKYPVFLVMVTGITFALAFHNMLGTFFLRIVERAGGNARNMGLALAIAAISELPILFFYSKLAKKTRSSSAVFLLISGAFFVVRGILFLLVESIIAIYLIQLLQSVSYALMTVAKASYADEVMAPEDETTGQSLMTMTDSFGAVAGSLIGGALIETGGVGSMLLWGTVIAFVGTGIIGTAVWRGKKKL